MVVERPQIKPGFKPTALKVVPDKIPLELRDLPCWLVWQYVEEIDTETGEVDWDKPPLNAKGGAGSSTNTKTHSSFDEAIDAYRKRKLDGIGFALNAKKGEEGEVLIAVDLDHCRNPETGEVEEWARGIIDELGSYTEVSPSGEGIRIFLRGKLPPHGRKRGNFECYCSGRYVTVTGHHVEGTPATIESRQPEFLIVHKRFWPEHHDQQNQHKAHPTTIVDLTDLEIVEKAKRSKHGEQFRDLWEGGLDGKPSASEADLALCSRIGWWVNYDTGRVDDLFRQSGRMRSKWNRADYRERTLKKACGGKSGGYEPRPPRATLHRSNGMNGKHTPDRFIVGPLVLHPGQPRQPPSGKITIPVHATREGRIVYTFLLSNAASGCKVPERMLRQLIGDDSSTERINTVLMEILAHAADQLTHQQAPSGPTVREIVSGKIPEALQLVCRSAGGLWSEALGEEVRRCDVIAFIPDWLINECAQASDAPKAANGAAVRPELIRLVQVELGVVWADLLSTLPPASDVDLGRETERGRQFRSAMIQLWKTPQTWEKQTTANTDTATKASLASRVNTKFNKGVNVTDRIKWEPVHPACDAWWRPHVFPGGELRPLLGMRWTLPGQVGIELPGVIGEESLTRLGKKFGVVTDPPEGVPSRLSGGKNRLAILTLELCDELLETPSEDSEENPRDAGTEG